MRHFILILIIFLYAMNIPLCAYCAADETPPQKEAQEVWVVVFVHGIMGIAPHINLQNIGLFIRDELIDTVYARAVNHIRKDTYFYQDQAIQKLGLIPIYMHDALEPGNAAALFAHIYNSIDQEVYGNSRRNIFYTYGWSGLLSRYQRYIESEGLLVGLYQLIESYKALGIDPKIRIIGYSHGGNVCLNMARMQTEIHPTIDITIDELIMIGMPVQMDTDYCCAYPLFKKVYNIFSHQDFIQKMDFFSSNRFLSNRQFTSRRSFKVPCSMIQINCKISRIKQTKMSREKIRKLSQQGLKTTTRSGQRRLLRDASPGHLELWFFGWTADKYRSHFPLYPLPAAVFIPYLLHIAEEYEADICNPYPITIDMRPELGYTLVSQWTKECSFTYQLPFIDVPVFEECCAKAYDAEPDNITSAIYQEHIGQALKEACKEYDADKQPELIRTKQGYRRRGRHKKLHKKARALPSHYKFLEPLS